MSIQWPDGKRFAFSIFDDTDNATLENVSAVYEFLAGLGFRTTKSVWPIAGRGVPVCGGQTCEDANYVEWLLRLQDIGFEIGFHNATYHTADRQTTLRALDRFRDLFGNDPKTMANHASNREAIYWGDARLSGLSRLVYLLLTGFRHRGQFRGHVVGDPLFWGDLCQSRVKYVRNFVYPHLNTLRACPQMPYHDSARPFVNYWFASTEGPNVHSFARFCSETSIERLEAEGGACIMYTHLANGFQESGQIHEGFRGTMHRLSRKAGWFVPVGELLDFLLQLRGQTVLSDAARRTLEWRWLRHKVAVGHS